MEALSCSESFPKERACKVYFWDFLIRRNAYKRTIATERETEMGIALPFIALENKILRLSHLKKRAFFPFVMYPMFLEPAKPSIDTKAACEPT